MIDLVTAGWFSGDAFVRVHSDKTLEVRVGDQVYRAAMRDWIGRVPSTHFARKLPHERAPFQVEPGEQG